jgi:hypothetical protein
MVLLLSRDARMPQLAMLSVDDVQIETFQMSDVGLGKSIYIKKQLEEFLTFQDSPGQGRFLCKKRKNWRRVAEMRKMNEG